MQVWMCLCILLTPLGNLAVGGSQVMRNWMVKFNIPGPRKGKGGRACRTGVRPKA